MFKDHDSESCSTNSRDMPRFLLPSSKRKFGPQQNVGPMGSDHKSQQRFDCSQEFVLDSIIMDDEM